MWVDIFFHVGASFFSIFVSMLNVNYLVGVNIQLTISVLTREGGEFMLLVESKT